MWIWVRKLEQKEMLRIGRIMDIYLRWSQQDFLKDYWYIMREERNKKKVQGFWPNGWMDQLLLVEMKLLQEN